MKLLERSKWPLLEPLFDLDRPGSLFAIGALRGNIGSLVYVDDDEKPAACIVLARNGWHVAAGRFDARAAADAAAVLRRPAAFARFPEHGVSTCRCVSLSDSFDAAAPFWEDVDSRDRELTTYRLSPEPVAASAAPEGVVMEAMTARDWPALEGMTSLAGYCWKDGESWAKQGIGFLARGEDTRLLGAIYSCCVAGEVHEPHLAYTHDADLEAVGLALALRYAEACRKRALACLWSCWSDGSVARSCVGKAGFVPLGSLRVRQFVRPLPEAQLG